MNDFIITRPWNPEIIDACHAEAIEMEKERRAEVHTVMPSGLVITRGMLEDEIGATRANHMSYVPSDDPWIIGVNASSNMFA